MPAPDAVLRDLRATLARIERGTPGDAPPPLSLCPAIDAQLPEGGLARGALHEIQAADPDAGLAFCGLILGRTTGPVLWISAASDSVWAPGLQALGLGADRLLLARYRQPADGTACGTCGAWGRRPRAGPSGPGSMSGRSAVKRRTHLAARCMVPGCGVTGSA